MLSFAALVVLAALAYWLRSQNLVLLVFAAAMIGALASPVIERVFLRTWPRYAPPGGSQGD